MQAILLVAVDSDLMYPAPKYGAFPSCQLADRVDIAASQVLGVLPGDVEILPRELARRRGRLARRIVELFPRIPGAPDQVADKQSRDRPVGHAIAGVAG